MADLDGNIITMLVLVFCSTVIGVIAVILGGIGLTQSGSGETYHVYGNSASPIKPVDQHTVSYSSPNDRVWMIAIGHYDNRVEYLDPVSYQIKGYDVDVIDAVCDIANKNCELVNDLYPNCYDSQAGQRQRGGVGLMSGWYDACTGWSKTHTRLLTFDFTDEFQKPDILNLYAKIGSTISYTQLDNLKIGFLDGWSTSEHCLARYDDRITGVPLDAVNIMHFITVDELITAVNGDTVQVVFAPKLAQLEQALDVISPSDFDNRCVAGGLGMMTRKENVEFITWWNYAFSQLVGTKRYDDICKNLLVEHAGIPGDDPNDICIGY